MNERIPYHDWNDGVDLSLLEVKKIEIDKVKWDLDLMKITLKNNIIVKLNDSMPLIHSIFMDKEILSEENWNIYINLSKLTEVDVYTLVNYKNNIFNIFETEVKNNTIFSKEERDIIYRDINSIYTIIWEIEVAFRDINKKNQNK